MEHLNLPRPICDKTGEIDDIWRYLKTYIALVAKETASAQRSTTRHNQREPELEQHIKYRRWTAHAHHLAAGLDQEGSTKDNKDTGKFLCERKG